MLFIWLLCRYMKSEYLEFSVDEPRLLQYHSRSHKYTLFDPVFLSINLRWNECDDPSASKSRAILPRPVTQALRMTLDAISLAEIFEEG